MPRDTASHVDAVTLTTLGMASRASCLDERIVRQVDGRGRDRLEADEEIGQPGVVEQPRELTGHLRRRRQHAVEAAEHERRLGLGGKRRARSGREQAAGEPDDQQRLGRADERAQHPVELPEDALAEPRRNAFARWPSRSPRRAPTLNEDSDEDDEGPSRRLDQRERLFEGWQRDEGDAADRDRAEEPDDLRHRPGAEPDHHRDDQDDDHDEVEQVHCQQVWTSRLRTSEPALWSGWR